MDEAKEAIGDMAIRIARLEERMSDQEKYRDKQNGSIDRLAGQVDSLKMWLIGLMGGVIANLIIQLVQIYK